jgi:hypothetical protein
VSGNWISWQTLIAFVLGVLLSAMVKGWTSQLKSAI